MRRLSLRALKGRRFLLRGKRLYKLILLDRDSYYRNESRRLGLSQTFKVVQRIWTWIIFFQAGTLRARFKKFKGKFWCRLWGSRCHQADQKICLCRIPAVPPYPNSWITSGSSNYSPSMQQLLCLIDSIKVPACSSNVSWQTSLERPEHSAERCFDV